MENGFKRDLRNYEVSRLKHKARPPRRPVDIPRVVEALATERPEVFALSFSPFFSGHA